MAGPHGHREERLDPLAGGDLPEVRAVERAHQDDSPVPVLLEGDVEGAGRRQHQGPRPPDLGQPGRDVRPHGGDHRLQAPGLELAGHEAGHQGRQPRQEHAGGPGAQRRRPAPHVQPDGEPEGAALAQDAGDADGAPHELRQALADGEAQAGAAVLAGGRVVALEERGKEPLHHIGPHADAGVPHLHAEDDLVAVLRLGPHPDLHGALVGELQGIVHEVGEDLAQAGGIARHGQRRGGIHEQAQLHALALGLHGQHRLHVLDDGQQVEVQGLEGQLPGLDLGEVEDVIDQREQRLPAGPDGLGVLSLLAAEGRVQQQARHADDAVHGRADLVGHVGQELALEARDLQGPVPRHLQLDGHLFELDLGPSALGDVVVLPEVAQVLLAHQDRHEVPGEDAAVRQGQLLAEHRHPRLGHRVLAGEEGLRLRQQRQALVQQVPGLALHQHVGRHGHLEQLAEGLVQEGDATPLRLHQDARLHVLDQRPQAAGGHAQHDLRALALGDVVEGARHAKHHAALVEGDALVGLHPLHLAGPGGHAKLPFEDRLAGVHRVGEHVEVARVVPGVQEPQEGQAEAFLHREASELGPGGIQEGPLPLAVDLEEHLLQVLHQGPVAVRLRPGRGQLCLERGLVSRWGERGRQPFPPHRPKVAEPQ